MSYKCVIIIYYLSLALKMKEYLLKAYNVLPFLCSKSWKWEGGNGQLRLLLGALQGMQNAIERAWIWEHVLEIVTGAERLVEFEKKMENAKVEIQT